MSIGVHETTNLEGEHTPSSRVLNQYGYFSADGAEYCITDPKTPRPWVNIIANPRLGLAVSQTGSGFTWVDNSQLAVITRWQQDLAAEGARLFAGFAVFVAGFALNQYHDRILIGLRKPGSGEYSIPYGGLFRYVSCPNFFGEIIEWAGFAVMVWSLPGLAFFVWTFVNLVPRALEHHKWYKSHFKDYPAERKAVIPFVL